MKIENEQILEEEKVDQELKQTFDLTVDKLKETELSYVLIVCKEIPLDNGRHLDQVASSINRFRAAIMSSVFADILKKSFPLWEKIKFVYRLF